MTEISGRIWLFGDNVNTDVIHPPEFFSLDPERVKLGLFHGLDPSIQQEISPDDILVAGRNFGCGSSRETSVRAVQLNRIGAVIAVDFARIFFRNATNNGLPCLTFTRQQDVDTLRQGQRATVLTDEAVLVTQDGVRIPLDQPGAFVRRIWDAGGLLAMLPAGPGSPH